MHLTKYMEDLDEKIENNIAHHEVEHINHVLTKEQQELLSKQELLADNSNV